jgi:hypothetical protein
LIKLLLLSVAALLLFSLESGVGLLLADTSHAPVASSFFATPLSSLAVDRPATSSLSTLSAEQPMAPPAAAAQAVLLPPGPQLPVTLLSEGRPVQASARGNLGPPGVVTSEAVGDWLADRWQAAANMQGEPLPGEHWLEVDLGAPHSLARVLIDFEKAFAVSYTVQSRLTQGEGGEAWGTVAEGSAAAQTEASEMHIIHELPARPGAVGRFVRLLIHQPATRWGTSVWRFHVYGSQLAAAV